MSDIKHPGVTFYQDQKGRWSWAYTGRGGTLLAVSGKTYCNRSGAMRSFKRLVQNVARRMHLK